MSLLTDIIDHLEKKGHWLESGTIEHNGKLWSYKFQQLKQKPKKQQICAKHHRELSDEEFDDIMKKRV